MDNVNYTTIANLFEILLDACCSSIFVLKYIPMISNLLKKYGWNTGNGFLDYMRENVEKLCGDPNITFAQVGTTLTDGYT